MYQNPKTIKFSSYFAHAFTPNLGPLAVDILQANAPKTSVEGKNFFKVANLLMEIDSCKVYSTPTNWTDMTEHTDHPHLTSSPTIPDQTTYSKLLFSKKIDVQCTFNFEI